MDRQGLRKDGRMDGIKEITTSLIGDRVCWDKQNENRK